MAVILTAFVPFCSKKSAGTQFEQRGIVNGTGGCGTIRLLQALSLNLFKNSTNMNLISFVPTTGRKPANAFESMFNEFFNHDFPVSFRNGFVQKSPAVNVVETQDGYRLEVAAPGLAKEDFEVKLDQDLLTISAKKTVNQEESKPAEKYTRREFSYMEFKRSFHLPETVDANSIKASYDSGVLHLALDKKPEAKPQPARVIEIG
jgi:HSP20 family protein